ncbi:MAG: glycoside hydrolase family 25 protein [Eubacteriales bacterium]|nr:glycoside hydrolase family 25 protein [Eubacteriales bacterium]
MKKVVTLSVFLICMLLTGCQKDYYGMGKAFSMSTSLLPGYHNDSMEALSNDNYERFLHASYIIVTDKFGEVQKIKISPNISRHSWDFSNLETDSNVKRYVTEDGFSSKVGVDVSEHQGFIDWERTSKAVDFAMIRVGYRGYGAKGGLVEDGYFSTNIEDATANGVPVGVYFYSQATSYEEGVEEANFVLSRIADYHLSYPIVLDREDPMVEDARTNDMSKEQHTQAALGFLETIRNAGYTPMMYTYRTYYSLYVDIESVYQYPIWYAQYADEPDWPYEFNIWQYTESGEIPGISGPVDLNLQMKEIE